MRILYVQPYAWTDFTNGATRSRRTRAEWMVAEGHDCLALCGARFDGTRPADLTAHLDGLGIAAEPAPPRVARRPIHAFRSNGVAVRMVDTVHNDPAAPDHAEFTQLVTSFDDLFAAARPDLVVAFGGDPFTREAMRRARAFGARTLLDLHNFGYEDPRHFAHADHASAVSGFLAEYYRSRTDVPITVLPPAIASDDILAEPGNRTFLTFVNPAPHKGAALFARLAAMLGEARPDIPVLVVQSGADATMLNSIPGIDFRRFPQIVTCPPVARPADFYEVTRVLLVPSVFEEPFGRVAAEAMMNGIPPIVSDRGALPEVVGKGGIVLPLPAGLTPESTVLPGEAEVRPWFDAVCRMWDDDDAYARLSAAARAGAAERFGERKQRRRLAQLIERVARPDRKGGAARPPRRARGTPWR